MDLLAQAAPVQTFWNAPNGSTQLWIRLGIAFLLGIGLILVLMAAPTRLRRPIVAGVTFLAGLFYVVFHYWPKPIDRHPADLPRNMSESVGFWLQDAMPVVSSFTNVLTGFLLGLGIYSLVRVHGRRLIKLQKDWVFSLVLLLSAAAMVVVGYADWASKRGTAGALLENKANWHSINYAADFLFDGLLQQMDAAMFSIIAFFILSAAYRAFRIRSIEASVLLASALIVIMSLMSAVDFVWSKGVNAINADPNSFAQNFTLYSLTGWLQANVQTPSIRGIDFGIGIGALAMGLRLWLSLEKSGTSA